MNDTSSSEIKREFMKSKSGLVGIGILACLIIMSIVAVITIPIDTFKQWNNPGNWISYPKTSIPIWVNYFIAEKIPEHTIIENPEIITKDGIISLTSQQFMLDYDYNDFPDGLIYEFDTEYSGSVLLHISVIRPDQTEMLLLSTSLPYSDTKTQHHERIFTTDNNIKKNLEFQSAN